MKGRRERASSARPSCLLKKYAYSFPVAYPNEYVHIARKYTPQSVNTPWFLLFIRYVYKKEKGPFVLKHWKTAISVSSLGLQGPMEQFLH